MGFCFSVSVLNKNRCFRHARKKVVRVVKIDGKVLEFKTPIIVKDLLLNLKGFGVVSSMADSQHLPLSYELRLGRVYYLVPSPISGEAAAAVFPGAHVVETSSSVKRIKVVITKQQLQELLLKKRSVEEVVTGAGKEGTLDFNSPTARSWKPSLRPIPEENEVCPML